MKKVQIMLAIAIVFAVSAHAQIAGGYEQRFKEHLINSYHFTPVQADSSVAVERDFQLQKHQQGSQMKALEDAKNARLAKFLSSAQIAQFNQAEKSMYHAPMRPFAPSGN